VGLPAIGGGTGSRSVM